MQFFHRFFRDESGATSIEYVVVAGFLSLAIAGGAWAIGANLVRFFSSVGAGLQ